MSIVTTHRDGLFETCWRRDHPVRLKILGLTASIAGVVLLFTPMLVAEWNSGLSLAWMLTVLFLLFWAGFRLLREASGCGFRRIRLHVASGEMEVRRGRGLLSGTRAYGAVEIECLVLGIREEAEAFAITAITRGGPPVSLIPGEGDEAACREVALVLAQGMGVPLLDRRYPDPEGKKDPPVRVGCTGDGRRTVYRWRYRDRFHPRAVLLGLGIVVALSSLLPWLALEIGVAMILPAVLDTLIALGLAVHTMAALTDRRVTVRADALRVERHLGPVPLKQRLIEFDSLAAIVVIRKGMWCAVFLRLAGDRTGVVLPFEEFEVAAWLKSTLEGAAHGVGRRRMVAARPGGA